MKTFKDVVMDKTLDVRWQQRGQNCSKYETHALLVNFWVNTDIVHELGSIRQTNDGRWRWTVKDSSDSRFAAPKNLDKVQGICNSKEEAMLKLETIWSIN